MVVTKGREMIEMECHWSEGTMLQLHRMNKYKALMDTMMTIIHNTIVDTGNLLRE